ncbi:MULTISPECIES: DedA family protein [unclassified Rickettsia]|uniref:DedA family protein n=1 Tax=unclassified Rickettsia TaxID=114295 RepID=UPI0020A09C33|nr:DedA family protein [Rickettsia endosymbiont of Ceutorhynchus assimilis]
MTPFETYSLLFVDSFVANLAIGFQRELIFHSMKMFGIYNPLMMLLVAVCACLAAITVNYIFGRILLNIFYFSKDEKNILRHKKFAQFCLKYDVILLSLIIFPFWGSFISLFAGFFRINFLKLLSVGCIVKACYYGIVLYTSLM